MNVNKISQYLKHVDSCKIKFFIEFLVIVIIGLILNSTIAIMSGIIIPLTIESVKEFQTDRGYEGGDAVAYLIGFILGNIIII